VFKSGEPLPVGCRRLGAVTGVDGRDERPIRTGASDTALRRLQNAVSEKGGNAVLLSDLICVDCDVRVVEIRGQALKCPVPQ
jgi:hypothetical protein